MKQLKFASKSGKSVPSDRLEPNADDNTKATTMFSGASFSTLTQGTSYSLVLVDGAGHEIGCLYALVLPPTNIVAP